MAEPIYKFWACRFLEPWYQLSKEELKLVLGSMVVCWIRGVPEHRSGPEVHGGCSGVKLVPILRGYERVGH
jgi:hypothetical protein